MSRISDGRDKGRRSHFLLRDECKRKARKRAAGDRAER